MIYEYAIDPEIAADSKNLQILENYFGFQYSRYISTFPKKWTKDIICQAKEKGSINGAKVVELLTFLKNRKALKDSGRTYISTISWEENAISAIPEFYCIVHENHVKISEISSGHEKFNIPINWRFKKSTENLKKQFSFVFEKGKVIYIIDRFLYNLFMAKKCTLFFIKRQVIINCPVKKSLFFEKCFLLINYLFFFNRLWCFSFSCF